MSSCIVSYYTNTMYCTDSFSRRDHLPTCYRKPSRCTEDALSGLSAPHSVAVCRLLGPIPSDSSSIKLVLDMMIIKGLQSVSRAATQASKQQHRLRHAFAIMSGASNTMSHMVQHSTQQHLPSPPQSDMAMRGICSKAQQACNTLQTPAYKHCTCPSATSIIAVQSYSRHAEAPRSPCYVCQHGPGNIKAMAYARTACGACRRP